MAINRTIFLGGGGAGVGKFQEDDTNITEKCVYGRVPQKLRR